MTVGAKGGDEVSSKPSNSLGGSSWIGCESRKCSDKRFLLLKIKVYGLCVQCCDNDNGPCCDGNGVFF